LSLKPALFLFLIPVLGPAATTVLFDPATPATGPFPTDFLTIPDPVQRTGLRLNLPVPDCAVEYTACQENALLDQTDGFSLRARIQVRFSGPVNPATLKEGISLAAADGGKPVGLNQFIWDPATNTAYAKADPVLEQGKRYVLIVTDQVRDTTGAAVIADPAFQTCTQAADGYCAALGKAIAPVLIGVISPNPPPVATTAPRIVAASFFTTMSATAWLERARDILRFVPPMVRFADPQSAFKIADMAGLSLHFQTGANPARFSDVSLPVDATLLAGIDRIVIGSFRSPRFQEDDQTIRPYPSLPDLSIPDFTNEIGFNVLVPSAPKPAGGYPVVIFGHGFGDSRFGGPTAIAPALARAGFAVIAINAVGHGFGPLSTVMFTDRAGKSVTLPALGRSIDLNNDGTIEANEGCALITPAPYGLRDCFRQTVVDLMQLARVIRLGLDLDGDGAPDLDGGRMYYGGQSLGAMYGSMFTALEPAIRAALLNVGGATSVEIARWSPAYKSLVTDMLRQRLPSLLNKGDSYDEDYVQPDQPVKTTTVSGAIAIQNSLELAEWLGMPGDPISFASRLGGARPVLFQFARADRTMPNPASTLLIRAAGLQSSTWIYRHDQARQKAPDLPLDPHPFLVLFVSLNGSTIQLPGAAGLAISLDAQTQAASFFNADGRSIADPNLLSRLLLGISAFEVPASLPVDLGF
jgi:pimeloyl-ACP methyl ester carboxylesterase